MAAKTNSCTGWVQGRRMRVTKLDSCGRPVEGDASVVVTSGFVSVGYTTDTDDGTEINVVNAAGESCFRVPAKPRFLGHTGTIVLCKVDPELVTLLTGQEVYYDYSGKPIGFTTDEDISVVNVNFALEVWAGVVGSDACDEENSDGEFGYLLLPFVQGGVIGDFSVENGAVNFTIQNASTKRGNRWGTGYYNVLRDAAGDPALLPTALTVSKHMLAISTSLAPPEAACGARPFLAIDGAAITSVTAAVAQLTVEFSVGLASSDPWWIDYGDGWWEYSADGAALTHVYEEGGTYDYTVHRGLDSESGQVTVAQS